MIDLGYRPREWQRACHMDRKRFSVFVLHRRAGKTELAIAELIDKALSFKLDLGLFFYVAPQLKQAKAIAWARLKRRVQPLHMRGKVEINEAELWVRFLHNGATIRVYGADNPDAMRGVRLDGVVCDEVSQFRPEVWDDILQPALSDRLGWAIFIGTVKGINLFSKLYFDADQPANLADWHRALYTVYDTDALPPAEVERLRATMSEISFRREFLCDFSAAGDEQLMSLMDIEDATRRHITSQDYDWAPLCLGVDPARFGDDRSALALRQGLKLVKLQVFHKMDNMTLAAHVAQWMEDYRPDAVFCDAGNGAGVIDRLRQLNHTIHEVNFGGSASKSRYVNKRTEIWYGVKEWIEQGGVLPADRALMMDLAGPTYGFNNKDQIVLESKDAMKARGLPSPDCGDALALTFAFPVKRIEAPITTVERLAGYRIQHETRPALPYDPIARRR